MTGRLKHPEHGFHHPMPGEAEGMLKNGWTWETDEAPPAPAAPPDPQPPKVDRRRKEFRNAASSDADQ